MTTWYEVRTQWVNGNRSDAKEMLYQQSKHRILMVLREAMERHYESLDEGSTCSGDLVDAIEILSAIIKGGK